MSVLHEWKRLGAVPLEEKSGILYIGVVEMTGTIAMGVQQLVSGKNIEFKQLSSNEWDKEYQLLLNAGSDALQQVTGQLRKEHHIDTADDEQNKDSKSTVAQLVDNLLIEALQRRASDIHFELAEHALYIRFRIDGALINAMEDLPSQVASEVVTRIKVLSELDVAERRIPQDGRFQKSLMGRMVDFRVSVMPTIFGENVVIRLLDREHLQQAGKLSLKDLGFPQRESSLLRTAAREPYGLVLMTGPTGSGKTTTLYGVVAETLATDEKMITIEDPVEYYLQGATQIPVNEKKGLTFARGLRSVLRHDPDKIMVGEIRDQETANIAVQAALTGHLVLTTVHANNGVDVIGRFLHMGVDLYNFISALHLVVAQRLVRILCPNCKESYQPQMKEWQENGLTGNPTELNKGVGCKECAGTGYQGRQVIAEMLPLSETFRQMVLERKSTAALKRYVSEQGVKTLRQAGLELVVEGKTSLQEINKVTFKDTQCVI